MGEIKQHTFIILLVFTLSIVFSCRKEYNYSVNNGVQQVRIGEATRSRDNDLGVQLVNPYSLEVMQEASDSLCAVLSMPEVTLLPNHIYLRFLPADSTEYNSLIQAGFNLFDYPLDYYFLTDGCSYHDSDLADDQMTWQYTCIDSNTIIPDIYYEVMDSCFIPVITPIRGDVTVETLSKMKNTDKEQFDACYERLLEEFACEIANSRNGLRAKRLEQIRVNSSCNPEGYVTLQKNSTTIEPLKGVTVKTWYFVKISYAYTDENGHYYIPREYSKDPHYSVRFENQKGFNIYNFLFDLTPAFYRISGNQSNAGYDIHFGCDHEEWLSAVVNNCAYNYYSICENEGRHLPPSNLKIATMQNSTFQGDGAPMLYHLGYQNISQYSMSEIMHLMLDCVTSAITSVFAGIMKYFLPDIMIQSEPSYEEIASSVYHELSHASHYAMSGQNIWNLVIAETIRNSVPEDNGYGDGTHNDLQERVGELAEAWAFANERLFEDSISLSDTTVTNGLWFEPSVLAIRQMVKDSLLTEEQILSRMTPTTYSIDDLYDKLVTAFSTKEALITDCFASRGALTSQTVWHIINSTGQSMSLYTMKNGVSKTQTIDSGGTLFFTSLPYVTSNFSNACPTYYPSIIGILVNGAPVYVQGYGSIVKPLARPFFNSTEWTSDLYTSQVGNTTIKHYYYTITTSDIL